MGRMGVRSGLAWAALAGAISLAGCGADDVPICTTNALGEPFMEPCACDAGGIGLRTCDATGTLGPCVCRNQSSGGGGTSGGMGATGGAGGTPGGAGGTTSGTGGTAPPPIGTDAGLDAGVDAGPPPCTGHSDCAAPTPFCVAGSCVECTIDGDCDAGESCDVVAHTCGPECTTGCSAPTPVCDTVTQTCVECLGASDCNAPTPFCATDHTCVACLAHTDCPPCFPPLVLTPCCNPDGTCACLGFVCPP